MIEILARGRNYDNQGSESAANTASRFASGFKRGKSRAT